MHDEALTSLAKMAIPLIVLIGLFTFLSISVWADARKKEREAFYRSEVRKKLIEKWGGENTEQLMNLLKDDSKSPELHQLFNLAQEEKTEDPRRRRERLILAGLITTAIGGGMLIFLKTMPTASEASNIGLIPLFVGLAILGYALFLGRN